MSPLQFYNIMNFNAPPLRVSYHPQEEPNPPTVKQHLEIWKNKSKPKVLEKLLSWTRIQFLRFNVSISREYFIRLQVNGQEVVTLLLPILSANPDSHLRILLRRRRIYIQIRLLANRQRFKVSRHCGGGGALFEYLIY